MKTKLSYQEQLKHPLWQKKRLEILQAADFKCKMCGAADVELHIHHRIYKKENLAWDYPNWALDCLCKDCHKLAEIHKKQLSYAHALSGIFDARIVGYATGAYLAMEPTASIPTTTSQYLFGILDFWGLSDDSPGCVLLRQLLDADGCIKGTQIIELVLKLGSTKRLINEFCREYADGKI